MNQYKSKIESLKSLISTSNSNTTTASQLLPETGMSLQMKKDAIRQDIRESVILDKEKNWANTSMTMSKIVKPIRGGQSNKSLKSETLSLLN